MIYLLLIVHEDGDNEITRVDLTEAQAKKKIYDGYVVFSQKDVEAGKLRDELLDYGNDEDDVEEAVTYSLTAPLNEPFVVGKI
jgi:hypothetical protein